MEEGNIHSIEEPPVKKKKMTEQEHIKASSSSEEIEMKPGPSFQTEEKDTTTVTETSDDSSNISSDDFTSADSSPEPSPLESKNPSKALKMKKTTLSGHGLTTAFRKTCENLKNLIEKRKVIVNQKEVTLTPPISEA